jgi:YD repeat-containing protein
MKAAIALAFLLATSSFYAQSGPAWEDYGFSKPVRIIRTEVERTVNGVRSPRVPEQTITFDEKGNVLNHTVHKPDGSVQRKHGWGYEYDAAGREIKTFYYDAKGVLTNTGVHLYDSKGRRIETTQINPDGSINHIRAFSYDEQGNIIRESHRNGNGSPRLLINRKYDANGRAIEEVFLDATGALLNRNVLSYDARGYKTRWILFKKDGTVVESARSSYTYDNSGNPLEAMRYWANGVLESKSAFTYEFDLRGNWIKRTWTREVFKGEKTEIEIEVAFRQLTYF